METKEHRKTTTHAIESTSMDANTAPNLHGRNGDHRDDAFATILSRLEAEGIKVISHDDGFIECPGQGLHTTQSAVNHCKVYSNLVNGIWVPCLNCFHASCRAVIIECNRRLYRAALAGRHLSCHNTQHEAVGCIRNQSHIARPKTPTVQEVLAKYPWTYLDIINDKRGKVEVPPEFHYFYILSLYDDDDNDNVWIGRDVYDTGTLNHRWRFRPVREWYDSLSCPGAFICPSIFRAGVHSRSSGNVRARKYLVVESDVLDRDQVGSVFQWLEAQGHVLRAVVDTGGKSLHGWFQYPPDPSCIQSLKQDLTALKCDPSMFGPSQPCRLPGVIREDTGRFQQLLYFKH